ncbi:unnamed protein product [Prunus armeniaca]
MVIPRESSHRTDSWNVRTSRNPSWTEGMSPSCPRTRNSISSRKPYTSSSPTEPAKTSTYSTAVVPCDQPLALLPEQPAVLPYRSRRMDHNPFPPLARGRRDRGRINPFAIMTGTDWGQSRGIIQILKKRRNIGRKFCPDHSDFEHNQPKQGRNPHPVNALNETGALQRLIREMTEPEAKRGERPTYRKPYPAYIDQIPLSSGFKVPNFTLFNGEDSHASSVEHIGRFSVQCIAIENNMLLKLRLSGNSLSGQAFTWYTSLPPNYVQTSEHMDNVFHDYYFRI